VIPLLARGRREGLGFDVISSGKAKAGQTFLYAQFMIESDEARVGKTQHQLQATDWKET
jgi:hypothetical protein